MKKTFLLLALLATAIGAMAQTDFRHITFEEAKAAAKAENKMIFVDFYTQWCGPCKMLAKKVFPTQEVGDFLNAGYVCLKLDAENEGRELAQAIKVDAYPTLAVFNANGDMIGSFAGYKEGVNFINSVKEISDPNLKPEVVEQKYLAGDRTPSVVQAYAGNKYEEDRNWEQRKAKVEPIISEYFESLSDADRLSPDNVFIFTSYTFDFESPRAQFLIKNRDKFDPAVKEGVESAISQVMLSKAIDYFSENNLADSANYANFKAFEKCLKDTGQYDKYGVYLLFAENRRTSGDDQYLDFCDKNFSSLDDTGVYYLVTQLPQLVTSDTKEQKAKISKLIRKHLVEMQASNIYSSGMTLYRLEADE